MYYLNTTKERLDDTFEFSTLNSAKRSNKFCDFKESNRLWTAFCWLTSWTASTERTGVSQNWNV